LGEGRCHVGELSTARRRRGRRLGWSPRGDRNVAWGTEVRVRTALSRQDTCRWGLAGFSAVDSAGRVLLPLVCGARCRRPSGR